MKCLCCGKELNNREELWHTSCIKAFFNTTTLPYLDMKVTDQELTKLGYNLLSNKKSVTGVQRKLSFHLSHEKNSVRLTLIGFPNGYIVKPEGDRYPYIARIEHLTMLMANEVGIITTKHGLIKTDDDKYVYITKRIDREENRKIHMEDFCQLSKRLTEYKYNSSYEKVAKVIDMYSTSPNLDKTNLFYTLLFCYVCGNSDMHLKNFSLIEDEEVCLSPFYDLLPAKLLTNDSEDMGLSLNGKKSNITRNDFVKYGNSIGLSNEAIEKEIKQLLLYENRLKEMIDESIIPTDIKEKYKEFITKKMSVLSKR